MVNPEDCANCLRILNRDGVADSSYQECHYCHHVYVQNGKRVLKEATNAHSPSKTVQAENKGVHKTIDKELE
jgi:nitrate/TMAO reductase-like tetraheme cytochrome c subunit